MRSPRRCPHHVRGDLRAGMIRRAVRAADKGFPDHPAAPRDVTFVDLGMSPLCESYVPAERLDGPETFYPLHVRLCESCLLVQIPAYVSRRGHLLGLRVLLVLLRLWVHHAGRYAEAMIGRLGLTSDEPGHRGREQRRLPAAAFRRRRHPGARRRAGRERRRDRPRHAASGPRSQFLGAETGQGDRRAVRPGRPGRRQQRVRARARYPRLRGRPARAGQGPRAWSRSSSRICSG